MTSRDLIQWLFFAMMFIAAILAPVFTIPENF